MREDAKPYEWIRKIPESIAKADTIPLLGDPPPFPWENLAEDLKKLLELQSLEITPSEFSWAEEGSATKGMGSPLAIKKFSIASLEGNFFVAMQEAEIAQIMDQLLLKGNKLAPLDDQFQSAFLDFLTLEIMHSIQQIGHAPELLPKLEEDCEIPNTPMLIMDLSLKADTFQASPRLLITAEMNHSLKKHYAKSRAGDPLKPPLSEQCDLIVHMEAGKTSLSQDQWKEVKPGDFILLERCSLNPGENTGTVTMTLKGHPILRGNIQDGNIKILENPLFREDN